eukprot:gene62522-85502_t
MTIHTRLKSTIAAALMGVAGLGLAIQTASADALADIMKAGTINVGVFADFPPFSSVGTDMSLN